MGPFNFKFIIPMPGEAVVFGQAPPLGTLGATRAASSSHRRCSRFSVEVGSRGCLQDVMRGILSNKNLYND
jgi:hypothetical protein